MAYKDIPLPGDAKNVSQADIRGNFSDIQTLVTKNHVDFGVGDTGKHNFIQLPAQGADPTTNDTEIALFCKNNAAGIPSLYFRPKTDGAVINCTDSTQNPKGYTNLPSGIILQWGSGSIAAGSRTSLVIPFEINFNDVPYIVNVTPYGEQADNIQDAILAVTTLAVGSFKVTRGDRMKGTIRNFYYMAIGR